MTTVNLDFEINTASVARGKRVIVRDLNEIGAAARSTEQLVRQAALGFQPPTRDIAPLQRSLKQEVIFQAPITHDPAQFIDGLTVPASSKIAKVPQVKPVTLFEDLVDSVKRAIQRAAKLHDLSTISGVEIGTLEKLQNQARLSNVQNATFQSLIKNLSSNLALMSQGIAAPFGQKADVLGFDFKAIDGSVDSLESVLDQVQTQFDVLATTSEKLALLAGLFGTSEGANLFPFFERRAETEAILDDAPFGPGSFLTREKGLEATKYNSQELTADLMVDDKIKNLTFDATAVLRELSSKYGDFEKSTREAIDETITNTKSATEKLIEELKSGVNDIISEIETQFDNLGKSISEQIKKTLEEMNVAPGLPVPMAPPAPSQNLIYPDQSSLFETFKSFNSQLATSQQILESLRAPYADVIALRHEELVALRTVAAVRDQPPALLRAPSSSQSVSVSFDGVNGPSRLTARPQFAALDAGAVTTAAYGENLQALEAPLARVVEGSRRFDDENARLAETLSRQSVPALAGYQEATRRLIEDQSGGLQDIRDAMDVALGHTENALARFVETGKLDFKDLTRSILADITRMMTHRLFTQFIDILLGSLGGFGGAGGGGSNAVLASVTGSSGLGPIGFGTASLFGGAFLGAAHGGLVTDGGLIRGPGTATSDSIPAALSNGEFVVNAQAATRHRDLLATINAGADFPQLRRGGSVGATAADREPALIAPDRGSALLGRIGGNADASPSPRALTAASSLPASRPIAMAAFPAQPIPPSMALRGDVQDRRVMRLEQDKAELREQARTTNVTLARISHTKGVGTGVGSPKGKEVRAARC